MQNVSNKAWDYFLEKNADESPDKVAVFTDVENVTFQQLRVGALRVGQKIRFLAPEDATVIIGLADGVALAWAVYGCISQGLPFVVVAPQAAEQTSKLFAGATFRIGMDSRLSESEIECIARDPGASGKASAGGNCLLHLLTTGSTGKAKVLSHSPESIIHCTESYAKGCLGMNESDVTLAVSSLSFGYALGANLLFPIACGGAATLLREKLVPSRLLKAINRFQPTIVFNIPSTLQKLISLANQHTSTRIRFQVSAGEHLAEEVQKRFETAWGQPVINGLGSAELAHIYISNRPGEKSLGSLGWPIDGYQVKLQCEEGEREGAILVKGPSLAEKTDEHGWFNTGDVAFQRSDGSYSFVGRVDSRFKVSGKYVTPEKVEEALLTCVSVGDVAVTYQRINGVTKPVAFLSSKVDDLDALKTAVADSCGKHSIPARWYDVEQMPRNSRGKLDRQALEGFLCN